MDTPVTAPGPGSKKEGGTPRGRRLRAPGQGAASAPRPGGLPQPLLRPNPADSAQHPPPSPARYPSQDPGRSPRRLSLRAAVAAAQISLFYARVSRDVRLRSRETWAGQAVKLRARAPTGPGAFVFAPIATHPQETPLGEDWEPKASPWDYLRGPGLCGSGFHWAAAWHRIVGTAPANGGLAGPNFPARRTSPQILPLQYLPE